MTLFGFGRHSTPTPCPVEKDALTASEIEALEHFRERIKELNNPRTHECTEVAHLRWLRARKFDVDKAYEMYKNFLEWREEKGIDKLNLNCFDQALKTKAVAFMGEDKQGRQGIVIFPARHTPGTLESHELENLMAFTIEVACQCLKTSDRFTILFDYEGWGLSCVDSTVDKVIMHVGQNNYPERLGEALLIKPPWYFSTVWSIVKVFLDEKTKSKFTFAKCYSEVTERFTPENLLTKYGGKMQEQSLEEFLMSKFESNCDMTLEEFRNKA